ncbi:hypothetical protein HY484_02300 [Candidatus Woesearchaeota archaeon]|nr:hypothetical protein [Candidatus Woesearchaeota archaeon]
MVYKLSQYVGQLRQQAHSRSFVKAHLLRQGYSPIIVSEVLKPSFPTVHPVKTNYFFVFLVTFFLVALIGLFLWWFFQPVEVSLKLNPVVSSVSSGNFVVFDKILSSSIDKVSVDVLYELLFDKKRVIERREKLLISGSQKIPSKFVVPAGIKSGDYLLKVTVFFNGNFVSDEFSVSVNEVAIPIVSVKNVSAETFNECVPKCVAVSQCTSAECVEGSCVSLPIIPCCGNGKCESDETVDSCLIDCSEPPSSKESVVDSALFVVKRDVSQAVLLCNSLIEDDAVDSCIETISEDSISSVVCDALRSRSSKDSCYMSFALDGDFSVCDKITDRYQSNSCWYLAQAKEFQSRQLA